MLACINYPIVRPKTSKTAGVLKLIETNKV